MRANSRATLAIRQDGPRVRQLTPLSERGWSHWPRTWARSWRLKAVAMQAGPGASFGTAGRQLSQVCLPNSGPRLLGDPSRLARVGCPACSGISHNTLKFIDLDQARFSADGTERPRTDSRLVGSSVDRPTICRRGEIGWSGACASYSAAVSESGSCSAAARV